MKRYMLFGFDYYYPVGGMNDFLNSFDSISDIQDYITSSKGNKGYYPEDYIGTYQIYDLETCQIVELPKDIVVQSEVPENKNIQEKYPCVMGTIQALIGNRYGDNG